MGYAPGISKMPLILGMSVAVDHYGSTVSLNLPSPEEVHLLSISAKE